MSLVNQPTKPTVLYVDDEPNNLSSFKAVFRKHYQIYLAQSASEGIEILAQHPIQLVITDQRMPNMTGVEFLEQISSKYPDITRIILTGYSDAEAIIAAVNKGQVYRYVSKPWEKDDLKETIDEAIEVFNLRRQNQELIQTLKKANQELDRFVYSASHDLRAPIASLVGLTKLVRLESKEDNIAEYMDYMENNLMRLDSFIKDIIDYSQNTRLDLNIKKIDIEALLQAVFEQHNYLPNAHLMQKNIKITQCASLHSDQRRLEIIFNNLISNAIRYADFEKQTPFVLIEVVITSLDLRIEIKDNGQGIGEAYLDKIFEMFFRANEDTQGSGLGLYIVRETVEKLQGTISVQSKIGQGTSFHLKLKNFLDKKDWLTDAFTEFLVIDKTI